MTALDSEPFDITASGTITLGVVSFLNARPLVEGLDTVERVRLQYAVPSRLAAMLAAGDVSVALLPVIDLLRAVEAYQIVSDACIACDGETMTVRIFSRIPAEEIEYLYADGDSHTSIAMAQVIWSGMYGRPLRIEPIGPGDSIEACDPVLLIGDKVVTTPVRHRQHRIDLGKAWKNWTGLPFVFAVWAGRPNPELARLAPQLSAARDRGCARAPQIARQAGPALGWPVDLAETYLTHSMSYVLGPRQRQGIRQFLNQAVRAGLAPAGREISFA